MSIRFRPFVNQCIALSGYGRDLFDLAADVTVIAPPEKEPANALFVLDGQIEKATAGAAGFSTLEEEVAIVRAREVTHDAVIRYTFEDCLVHEAGLDVAGGKFRKKRPNGVKLLTEPLTGLSGAAYCMSGVSERFFGHWIRDACATALLAAPDEALILDTRPDWPHAAQYADALRLAPERAAMIRVDRLTLHQDHSQGSLKRARYARMRRRLAAAFPGEAGGAGAVYFRRGASGVARLIANEDEVTDRLSREGFDVVDVEGTSLGEIQRRFRRARLVVSVEGSHLNHLHFAMQPGACLITLVPADYFNAIHVGIAQAVGLRYGFMVIDPVENGYRVDCDDLLATRDLAAPHG